MGESLNWYRQLMNVITKVLNFLKVPSDGRDSVLWLSHHIPKTAGTSLKNGYAKAFGSGAIRQMYSPDEVRLAGNAKMQMKPVGTKIINGHCH